MSYDVQPPFISIRRFMRNADDHEHSFDSVRVVLLRSPRAGEPDAAIRSPVRFCECGQVTSNGVPELTERIRIVQVPSPTQDPGTEV